MGRADDGRRAHGERNTSSARLVGTRSETWRSEKGEGSIMMRRRVGRPLLRTAVVAGGAYAAGDYAARRRAEQEQLDTQQNAQIEQLQQQQTAAYQQPAYAQPAYGAPPAPPYAPPPPPPAYAQTTPEPIAAAPAQNPMEVLKQLGDLKAAGVITQEEFDAKKAQLLSQI